MYATAPKHNILNSIVSISRFNKGEAGKIFADVKKNGMFFVVKNNVPECVLLSPKEYQDMLDQLEDAILYADAVTRLNNTDLSKSISHEDLMKKFNITPSDLDDVDVELE